MKPNAKRQIVSGLQIGGSLGLFFIAAMIAGIAVDGLRDQDLGHLQLWPNGAIAAGLITVAAGLMVITARVWILFIAGSLLFFIPKCLIIILNGYRPSAPFSGSEAVELILFSAVSLFLIWRVIETHKPGIVDRLAFTLFVFCLVFALSHHGIALVFWQTFGLAVLGLAWLWAYWKRSKRRDAYSGKRLETARNLQP
jgi:hypothetical protein